MVSQARDIVRVNMLAESAANGPSPFGEIIVGYLSEFDRHWSK
jgi:hypothetical protein